MRRLMAKRFTGLYVIVTPRIVCGWYGGKNNMALGLLRFNAGASALSIPLAPSSEAQGAEGAEGDSMSPTERDEAVAQGPHAELDHRHGSLGDEAGGT